MSVASASLSRLATLLLVLLLPCAALAKGFGSPVDYPLAPEAGAPVEVVSGDFNNDGKIDLVVSSVSAFPDVHPFLTTLLGNGDGTLQSPLTFPMGDTFFHAQVARDFDHDGNLDVAGASSGGTSGYSAILILFGNGDGTFTRTKAIPLPSKLPSVASITVADLNGDGLLDWVVNFYFYSAEVLIAQPGGGYIGHFLRGIQPYNIVLQMAVGDVNNDRISDILDIEQVIIDSPAPSIECVVGQFLGKGDGTFARETYVALPPDLFTLSLGDINHDGNLDFVVGQGQEGPANVTAYLGAGNGSFQPVQRFHIQGRSHGGPALLADLNHDGNLDIADANPSGIAIFSGAGDGTFNYAGSFNANGAAGYLIPVELNGDHRLDLAVPNYRAASITVLLNQP